MDYNLKKKPTTHIKGETTAENTRSFLGIWTQTKTPRNKMQLPSTTGRKYFRECSDFKQLILFTKKTQKNTGEIYFGKSSLMRKHQRRFARN